MQRLRLGLAVLFDKEALFEGFGQTGSDFLTGSFLLRVMSKKSSEKLWPFGLKRPVFLALSIDKKQCSSKCKIFV